MFIQELQLQSIRSRVTSNDQLRLDTNFQILVRKFLPFVTIVSLAIFCLKRIRNPKYIVPENNLNETLDTLILCQDILFARQKKKSFQFFVNIFLKRISRLVLKTRNEREM